jgi:hypothetical protein
MKVILFGTSGMVGQGVLLECLRDPEVEHVLSIARRPGRRQPVLATAAINAVAARAMAVPAT